MNQARLSPLVLTVRMAQGLFPAHASPDKGSSPLSSPSLNQCRHIPTLARVLPNHSSKCRKPSALLAHNRTGFRNPSMRRARSSHHPARRVSSHTGTRFSHTCRTRSASSYATCACAEPTRHIKPTVEHRCTSAPFSHVCAELAQHIKATIKHRLIPAPNVRLCVDPARHIIFAFEYYRIPAPFVRTCTELARHITHVLGIVTSRHPCFRRWRTPCAPTRRPARPASYPCPSKGDD